MHDAEKYPIQKGLPIPPPSRGIKGRYPYSIVEVGDSFFVPDPAPGKPYTVKRSMAGKRFTARVVTENGVRGQRIWRTA